MRNINKAKEFSKAIAAALLLFSAAAQASFTVSISHSSPASNDRLQASLQEFKKNVEERTAGEIKINIYPASQLGGEREQLEGVQLGSIDMAVLSGPMATVYPEIMIFDLPFLFQDRATAHRVLDGEFGQRILDGMLNKTGIRGLAWGENGFRHFTNSSRPIEKPEDVRGLRIRTMENPAHMAMVEALGGRPTPMAFGEVYSSLQLGVIDGQENPISLIESMRFHEVQEYLTLDGHVYNPFMLIVNEMTWQSFPDDYKEIILEESRSWSLLQREMNEIQEESGLQKIQDNGVAVNRLSEEDVEIFRAATESVYEMYRRELGEQLVNDLMETVEEARGSDS